MANLQNSSLVPTRGSGRWAAFEINSTGSQIAPVFSGPWASGSSIADDTPQETRDTEGSTQFTADGVRTATFSLTLMQTDPDTLSFVKDNGGKYYVICKEINETALDGKRSWFIFAKAKMPKTFNYTAPGGEIEVVFNLENPGSSFSAINTGLFSTGVGMSQTLTGSWTPANNEYYKIQTASAT